MRKVYVVGTGSTPVGEHWGQTASSLANQALAQALGEYPVDRLQALYVANALGSSLGVQSQIGTLIASNAGLATIEQLTIEAGGASGGVALRQAYLAIASGIYDLVAVVGVEKVTDVLDNRLEAGLALGTDADWEALHGTTLTAQWAMLMRRYMHQYGVNGGDFAAFPVNAHANGSANKQALYRFPTSLEKVRAATPVADPLVLLDCSTIADGAAVVILAAEGLAREFSDQPVRIAGSAVGNDVVALHRRADPLWLGAAARSTAGALHEARLSISDINVLEFSDPHGIAAVLALEASGLAERGTGVQLGIEGAINPKGRTPLATGGGYKSRGDVVGATGVYQIIELVRQLRGAAGTAQVANAKTALAQCVSGVGVSAATHILIAE
jgi:acetyl-CoA C-acetyltransferase